MAAVSREIDFSRPSSQVLNEVWQELYKGRNGNLKYEVTQNKDNGDNAFKATCKFPVPQEGHSVINLEGSGNGKSKADSRHAAARVILEKLLNSQLVSGFNFQRKTCETIPQECLDLRDDNFVHNRTVKVIIETDGPSRLRTCEWVSLRVSSSLHKSIDELVLLLQEMKSGKSLSYSDQSNESGNFELQDKSEATDSAMNYVMPSGEETMGDLLSSHKTHSHGMERSGNSVVKKSRVKKLRIGVHRQNSNSVPENAESVRGRGTFSGDNGKFNEFLSRGTLVKRTQRMHSVIINMEKIHELETLRQSTDASTMQCYFSVGFERNSNEVYYDVSQSGDCNLNVFKTLHGHQTGLLDNICHDLFNAVRQLHQGKLYHGKINLQNSYPLATEDLTYVNGNFLQCLGNVFSSSIVFETSNKDKHISLRNQLGAFLRYIQTKQNESKTFKIVCADIQNNGNLIDSNKRTYEGFVRNLGDYKKWKGWLHPKVIDWINKIGRNSLPKE